MFHIRSFGRSKDPADDLQRHGLRTFAEVLGWVVACNAAGGLGAIATADDREEWFSQLAKPSFNPPDAVFAPVWTSLYTMMGIAGFLASRSRGPEAERTRALRLFAVQLMLNALWSFIFFEFRSPRAALIEIALLLGAIILTMRALFKLSNVAGLLFVPYLIWVAFATLLNARIWQLNQ